MDFVKHNLIFVILLGVCVVLLGVMGFFCGSAHSKLQAQMEKANKTQQYFDKVRKKNIKLDPENITTAQNIAKQAAERRDEFISDLREHFHMTFDVPEIPLVALKKVKDEVATQRNMLLDNDVELTSTTEKLSLDEFVDSTQAPKKDDVPKMFRKLELVKTIVQLIIDSKDAKSAEPMVFEDINFLKGLDYQTEGNYTITPIEIKIKTSNKEGQALMNALVNCPGKLFFVRNVTVESPPSVTQVATSVGIDGKVESRNNEGNLGGGGNSRSRGGAISSRNMNVGGGTESRRVSTRRQREAAREDGMNGMMMGRSGNMEGDNNIEIPKFRNDYIAFEQTYVTWTIRFDYIDFPPEEKEPEPEESNGNEGEMPLPPAAE